MRDLSVAFVTLFVAVDILGVLPLYLSLTGNMCSEERGRLPWQSTLTATAVGLGFLLGDFIPASSGNLLIPRRWWRRLRYRVKVIGGKRGPQPPYELRMKIRLLLVDDDPGFRLTLRDLLAQREEAVILGEAGNGEEALRLVDTLRPDVVLMDLAMPGMNGLEVTRRLKTHQPGVVVVIITVHDEDVYRRTALAAGAEAFLEKKTLGANLWPTLVRIVQEEKAD